MKNLKNIFIVALVVLAISACKNKENEVEVVEIETASTDVKKLDANATYAKAEFTIDGMTCAVGCAKTIEKKLARMEGVKSAKVDFDKKLAMVEFDKDKVNHASLSQTVTKVADIYKVSDMHSVDVFSAKKACSKDCKKDCCKKENKACIKNCKKACCAGKV